MILNLVTITTRMQTMTATIAVGRTMTTTIKKIVTVTTIAKRSFGPLQGCGLDSANGLLKRAQFLHPASAMGASFLQHPMP